MTLQKGARMVGVWGWVLQALAEKRRGPQLLPVLR